ncbi:MAG: type III-A CRISPR-associated RAMP protein Csm4 [Acholeplasmataceae bacterium]|jgi:CRISPR-associated protein Csm4|nr:type III-A CRISPR-associated RAMP protein Csm4 [Acholeplasmataceae bacterium]
MSLKRKVLKLKFTTALHYGNNGKPGLLSTDSMILSDTIYSAICDIEPKDIDKLINLVENKKLLISDMLPYVGDKLLIPKGIGMIKFEEGKEIDRTVYKKIKKLDYLPVDKVEKMASKCSEELIEEALTLQEKIGVFSIKTSNRISRNEEDTLPFIMEIFTFYKNAGLYLLIDYDNEETFNFIKEKIISLGLLGVGGKRSSGLGKFEVVEITDFPLNKDKGRYLLLSTALPSEEVELANFSVVKRSGFYEQENEVYKKRDIFAIKSGLVVDVPFTGVILNDLAKNHTVYRFLMPLFVRLEI